MEVLGRESGPHVRRFPAAALALLSLIASADAANAVALLHGDIVAITAETWSLAGGSLVRIDPVTGAQSVISEGAYVDVGLTHDGRIFAVTTSEVVEVQPGTGDIRIVRDLSDLGTGRALAVGPSGELFVAYEDLATRLSGIEAIDPMSGAGASLSALGTFGRVADLEFVAGSKIATIAETPGGDHGELPLEIIDAMTGVSVLSGPPIVQGNAVAGALGVSAAGDRVAWAATGHQGTTAWEMVIATGESNPIFLPLYRTPFGACYESCAVNDLSRSDVAYEASGDFLMSVYPNGETSGLFRVGRDEAYGAFADGTFSEVQVMVPEPSTALLLLAGLLGLAMASGRRPA
jgi:hypothetical protein